MSNKIAVIGIGNTLRRDDGIGIVIFESLLALYKRQEIDYLNFGTASFDLIHHIERYSRVLVIDGIDASLEPGELKIAELKDIACNLKGASSSTHALDVNVMLNLYKELGIKTKIYFAAIQVADISYGEGLTHMLARSKDAIVRKIGTFIDEKLLAHA